MSDLGSPDLSGRIGFARIDAETRRLVQTLWPVVEEALPGILERFYAHLMKEPSLKAMLEGRLKGLQSAQTSHWQRLFSGRFDDDYVRSIDRIGRAHGRIGLEPRWYIAGYQFVLNELVEVVVGRFRFSARKTSAAIVALNKVVLLDLDFAISTYQQMLIEQRVAQTNRLNAAVETFKVKVESALQHVEVSANRMQEQAGTLSGVAGSAADEAVSASAASEETSVSVQTVASAAEELSSSIEEIARQVAGASEVARRANGMADTTSREVARLSEAAQKIGDVVRLITDIAAQTNLLALNATIEAARAGEAGRGFAIVAQEVKQLAGQTSKATEDIAKQISEVQSSTANAVDAISAISSTVGEIDELTSAIATAIEQQGAATREISENVQNAAQGTVMLSANVTGVNAAIDATGKAAEDFLTVSTTLRSHSSDISNQVRAFFSEIREVAGEKGGARAA